MKKLKLLFPLFTTSALAVAPALAAQSSLTYKSSGSRLKDGPLYHKDRISTDNNKLLFLDGKTHGHYYGGDGDPHNYTGANLTFTFTSYGATMLAKAKTTTTHKTGGMVMSFLDKNLKHFDNGIKNSYLNEIEGVSSDRLMNVHDGYAYNKFMNVISDPDYDVDSVVSKITDMFIKGEKLPSISVWFHYAWHPFESNTYDVIFTILK